MFEKAKQKIFLTGSKSREYFSGLDKKLFTNAGGFYVNELPDPEGYTSAYELFPAGAGADISLYSGQRFMDFSKGREVHDTEVFRSFGVKLMQEAVWYEYSMLYYLGGLELIVPEFYAALTEYLHLSQPCLGAVLSMNEAELIRRRLGLSLRYTMTVSKFVSGLKNIDSLQILDTDKLSSKKICRILDEWSNLYV